MSQVTTAGLYDLPNGILIHAYAPTNTGFMLAVEPSVLLPRDAPVEQVGAELIRVMKQKQPIRAAPNRSDFMDIGDPVLRAVGMRSWREVQRNSQACVVEAGNGGFRFILRGGLRGARPFEHLNDRVLQVQSSAPGVVGEAARTALGLDLGPQGRAA